MQSVVTDWIGNGAFTLNESSISTNRLAHVASLLGMPLSSWPARAALFGSSRRGNRFDAREVQTKDVGDGRRMKLIPVRRRDHREGETERRHRLRDALRLFEIEVCRAPLLDRAKSPGTGAGRAEYREDMKMAMRWFQHS
jgi:hypothetical protein